MKWNLVFSLEFNFTLEFNFSLNPIINICFIYITHLSNYIKLMMCGGNINEKDSK